MVEKCGREVWPMCFSVSAFALSGGVRRGTEHRYVHEDPRDEGRRLPHAKCVARLYLASSGMVLTNSVCVCRRKAG